MIEQGGAVSTTGDIARSTTRLPILDVRFCGMPTADNYRHHLEEVTRILQGRSSPIAILLDMREFNPLTVTAQMRKDAAALWHEHRQLMVRSIAAEARVISNPLVRGVMTAFDWLTSTPDRWPCKQFAVVETAETWLREQLTEAEKRRGDQTRLEER